MLTDLDRQLCRALCDHPRKYGNRYTPAARDDLLEVLFRCLTGDRPGYLQMLFPDGFPKSFRLQEAQGVVEHAEYTEAARGQPCGHIFKQGEASYHCMTCTDDESCVLCARCWDSSDHEGHQFHISASLGNNGCCDCGDDEAWKRSVRCAIHTAHDGATPPVELPSDLPTDVQEAIHTTIGRALDYFCDVISCSPENLRAPKTAESVKHDESYSRLEEKSYFSGDEFEANPEFCLVLWNDEKHTIEGVKMQVARACNERESFGLKMATQADDAGRTVVRHSRDVDELIRMCKILEQIKVTVTIRSSRDTYREQMCGTIVNWLSDIAACSFGNDHHILRKTIAEELLQEWHVGSEAYNAKVGRNGIWDSSKEAEDLDVQEARRGRILLNQFRIAEQLVDAQAFEDDEDGGPDQDNDEDAGDDDIEEDEDDEEDERYMDDAIYLPEDDPDQMEVEMNDATGDLEQPTDGDEMETDDDGRTEEAATTAVQRPRPLAIPVSTDQGAAVMTPTESDVLSDDRNQNFMNVPKTPHVESTTIHDQPPDYWAVLPSAFQLDRPDLPPHEDLTNNIRLDSMILFDLRLWKVTRIALRNLYLSTVVNIARFKRILGLRFSGLYTTLSQLYLVADREPDHSIINLSLQMLTSPSITEEIIERGNFLTNLMAILYTFLTTRQVGYPKDVDPTATLTFDSGSVANRRLHHFFADLRYFLASDFVQERVRTEKQYLRQYLDLAKLSQGICPNERAVGEHVEYETDTWISASLLTREINKLSFQFAEAFKGKRGKQASVLDSTCEAIYHTACMTIVNSIGLERKRFDQNEIKELTRFKVLQPFHFEQKSAPHRVVDFVVQDGALSFHHALHYTLSWLLQFAEESHQGLTALVTAAQHSIRDLSESPLKNTFVSVDDALLATFDFPLRVSAWLAQMKAGMWVRNGMSLRHQMMQYKNVLHRDFGHHRDLFLLQTAMVVCDPSRVLATMIDRYGLEEWMRGEFKSTHGRENPQTVDLAEDFVFLLISILSDRDALIPLEDEPDPETVALRKDLVHTLCFKSLSFSDLSIRMPERSQDPPQLQSLLYEMANYRPPEGLHDSGIFELKPEFLQELDPYNSHFSKNQRDEAENIYKKWMSKTTNRPIEDIVLEPRLREIRSGAYMQLTAVTGTPLFAQVIYSCLEYALEAQMETPDIPSMRVEAFLHVVLQLALIATMEDRTMEDEEGDKDRRPPIDSFVYHTLTLSSASSRLSRSTIITMLQKISHLEHFESCRSKIKHMLKLFVRKRERLFHQVTAHLDFPYGRLDTASPANAEVDVEAKRKQALERKAKVMAQFQQQQQNFMDNQGMIDWDDDDVSDTDTEVPGSGQTRLWKFPSGVCIQCREEMNDSRLYGTFAMTIESHVLRETPMEDPDFVREVLEVPDNLDSSMDTQRPFGVSAANHKPVKRINSAGEEIVVDRQGLGKGWPHGHTRKGPVMTSCGHIMHYACFENYHASITRRQSHQIARNHPERLSQKEFVCPLCKALANTFIPIIWKHAEQSYPGKLSTKQSLDQYLELSLPAQLEKQRRTESAKRRLSTGVPHTPQDWEQSDTFRSLPALNLRDQLGLSAFDELNRIYARLGETLGVVKGQASPVSRKMEAHDHLDLLVTCIANTISATEIGYRGVERDPGTTLISRIPQQTLSYLQILSKTVGSYSAMNAVAVPGTNDTSHDIIYRVISRQLFPPGWSKKSAGLAQAKTRPLLLEDSFSVLTQATFILPPKFDIGLHKLLALCYRAEVLRVLLAIISSPHGFTQASWLGKPMHAVLQKAELLPPEEFRCLVSASRWIEDQFFEPANNVGVSSDISYTVRVRARQVFDRGASSSQLYKLIQTYALTFLRKAAILFHVAWSVDFPPNPADSDVPELKRLTTLLDLPALNEILLEYNEHSSQTAYRKLAASWFYDFMDFAYKPESSSQLSDVKSPLFSPKSMVPVQLLHPAPLELIGLPKYFDNLMEESHKRTCPKTGKELTDPALCLFCGAIFCSQAYCCTDKDGRGGCNQHITNCSSPIGMFLFTRKCMVLLLHVVPISSTTTSGDFAGRATTQTNGSWFAAPYLTKHGETDQGLRSRHQLILNQKRYDKLYREAWLMTNASVWSMVARKLEGEINAGGWETL